MLIFVLLYHNFTGQWNILPSNAKFPHANKLPRVATSETETIRGNVGGKEMRKKWEVENLDYDPLHTARSNMLASQLMWSMQEQLNKEWSTKTLGKHPAMMLYPVTSLKPVGADHLTVFADINLLLLRSETQTWFRIFINSSAQEQQSTCLNNYPRVALMCFHR